LQSARNPATPCKPDSLDYIAPFPRTRPGKAPDGEPIYDLDVELRFHTLASGGLLRRWDR